jgi:hypothetical protein
MPPVYPRNACSKWSADESCVRPRVANWAANLATGCSIGIGGYHLVVSLDRPHAVRWSQYRSPGARQKASTPTTTPTSAPLRVLSWTGGWAPLTRATLDRLEGLALTGGR